MECPSSATAGAARQGSARMQQGTAGARRGATPSHLIRRPWRPPSDRATYDITSGEAIIVPDEHETCKDTSHDIDQTVTRCKTDALEDAHIVPRPRTRRIDTDKCPTDSLPAKAEARDRVIDRVGAGAPVRVVITNTITIRVPIGTPRLGRKHGSG